MTYMSLFSLDKRRDRAGKGEGEFDKSIQMHKRLISRRWQLTIPSPLATVQIVMNLNYSMRGLSWILRRIV